MEFTGEQNIPEIHGNTELEYIHRYLQSLEIVIGKNILDIASGEGYGSAILSKKANKVTGVDISFEAVKQSHKCYKIDNLNFIVGSCLDIPLADTSVDLVVSFETIEHVDQYVQMMKEIKRVLRPAGALLISIPDKYHSVETGYCNPYQKKELYLHEFKQLLDTNFSNTTYFGQRIVYGSNISSESKLTSSLSYFQENGIIRNYPGITRPTYWIALASDTQLPELSSSFFEQPINDSGIIKSWNRIVSERDQTIQTLATQISETNIENQILSIKLSQSQEEVVNYALSRSWRITRPLRKFINFMKRIKNA